MLAEKKIPFPDFLKLDAQGHEIEVLKGGLKALSHTEICLLEVTLIGLGDQSTLFTEINNFMDQKGFQIYDVCQFMRRPYDKAMYQMDIMFVKKNSTLVSDKRWN